MKRELPNGSNAENLELVVGQICQSQNLSGNALMALNKSFSKVWVTSSGKEQLK